MSDPVGRTEIPVDAQIARRAIHEQFPRLDPVRVEAFGEGWDFTMFLVDGDKLFRFPKRRACIEGLLREQVILRAIGPALELAVPEYRWSSSGAAAFSAPFAGYLLIEGTIAARVPRSNVDRDAVLEQVARFLEVLHATPMSVARAAGVDHDPHDDWRAIDTDGVDHLLHRIELIADELPVEVHRAARRYAPTMRDPPVPSAPEVLIHDDLTAVHMVVDEGSKKLSGIIDWADVHIGHPIADVTGWYGWLGRSFAEALLQRLGVDDPEPWLTWIRDRLFLLGISEIFHARDTGSDDARAMGHQVLSQVL